MKLKAVGVAAALLCAAEAGAQTEHDARVWFNANVQGSISGPLLYYAEIQPRIGDDVSRLRQIILRPAIGYRLSNRVSVFQGYAHVDNPQRGRDGANEERSFQQLSWTVPTSGALNLSSRTRLEQRWQSNGNDTGHRVREMVRLAVPVTERKGGTAALVWGELFVALNDTDWGARSGFDQSRLFAGVDVPLTATLRSEIGYLNQYVNQTRGRQAINHVASFSLVWRP